MKHEQGRQCSMEPFDLRLWPNFQQAGGEIATQAMIDQIATDSRRIYSSNALFVALEGQSKDGHQFVPGTSARWALVRRSWDGSAGPGTTLLRVLSPLEAFQQITNRYRHQFTCPLIAVCGSYGKTMVKDLLHSLLSTTYCTAASPESFNSQIGVPLSLLQINKSSECAIIETSFSKIDEMARLANMVNPSAVILTHIGEKHLETLGNLSTTALEMLAMLRQAKDWVLIPQHPLLDPFLKDLRCRIHFWNLPSSALPHAQFISSSAVNEMIYRVTFPEGNIFEGAVSSGFYYFLDLLNIAVKAAWLRGVREQQISEILTDYSPKPVRTEIFETPAGTTVINTPYCSDLQSVETALRQFPQIAPDGKRIFLFGGLRTSLPTDYRRVGQLAIQAQIAHIGLVGDHPFSPLNELLKARQNAINFSHHASFIQALKELQSSWTTHDHVLIKGAVQEPLDRLIISLYDSIHTNCCWVNFAAIAANIALFRRQLPINTRLMVIVKALAYGTDSIRIARFLDTCAVDILGVSTVDEGVMLRRAGVKQNIFSLHAALYEITKIVRWGIEVGVSNLATIKALDTEAALQNKRIHVHLHLDTGMNRLGCKQEQALVLAQAIQSSNHLHLEGLMTHFVSAENPQQDAFTRLQIKRFHDVIQELSTHGIDPPWKHAANSAAALRFTLPDCNMARLGLAIYGLYPSAATRGPLPLRLALSLTSHIVGINYCHQGETVSYGQKYTVKRPQEKIAVVPLGYFDGLHRHYSGRGEVIIRGMRAKMVGSICMDYMMVDVTDIPNASTGDPVLIFGEDEYGNYLSSEELAEKGGSIAHELITCLGPRIPRIFIYEEGSSRQERLN